MKRKKNPKKQTKKKTIEELELRKLKSCKMIGEKKKGWHFFRQNKGSIEKRIFNVLKDKYYKTN